MITIDETCMLGSIVQSKNDYGDVVSTTTWNTVYCTEQSIGRSEYYQATASGVKPSIILTVRLEDYSDESLCNYKNVSYDVMKTYRKDKEYIELTLSRKVVSKL